MASSFAFSFDSCCLFNINLYESYFFYLRALLNIHKNFSFKLYFCIDHAHFLSLNDDIADIQKSVGMCSSTFLVDDFSSNKNHHYFLILYL